MTPEFSRLTIQQLEAQRQTLSELEKVYSIRLGRAERKVFETARQSKELDELLGLLREDLMRVDAQRQNWGRRWQEWLEGGGELQHGRGFTLRHAELGELENVLLHHQGEIGAQHQKLRLQLDAARNEYRKLVRQRDELTKKSKLLRRVVEAQRESRQEEMASEHALVNWYDEKISDRMHELAAGFAL